MIYYNLILKVRVNNFKTNQSEDMTKQSQLQTLNMF